MPAHARRTTINKKKKKEVNGNKTEPPKDTKTNKTPTKPKRSTRKPATKKTEDKK